MKKNKFMRLASVMLMLCLITTCAISGTFAKYTTSATATDTARVAKWGVKVVVTGKEAFAKDRSQADFRPTLREEEAPTSRAPSKYTSKSSRNRAM